MSEESIEQEPVPEHWETQLQERVEALYAKRAAPLAAEVERLQAGLDESCARLLEQARARVAPEEVAGLRAEVGQWLAASAEAAERDFEARLEQACDEAEQEFQARLEQACQEAAAGARREAEEELQARLEQERQETGTLARREAEKEVAQLRDQLAASRQALAVAVAEAEARPPAAATPEVDIGLAFDALRTAIEEINTGRTEAETLTALVNHAADFAPRIIFFVARGGDAVGWKARGFAGGGPDDDSVRSLTVSKQAGTMVGVALNSQRTTASQAAEELSAVLGRFGSPAPARAVAVPLVIRRKGVDKAAAVLYADSGAEAGEEVYAAALEILVRVTSMAVELLPLRRSAEPPATGAPAPPAGTPGPREAPPGPQSPRSMSPAEATVDPEAREHHEARSAARVLVSDLKFQHAEKVIEGRLNADLYERLKLEIDRSRKAYQTRVSPNVASKFDYFYDELVRTLAEGDPGKLGQSYPGPLA